MEAQPKGCRQEGIAAQLHQEGKPQEKQEPGLEEIVVAKARQTEIGIILEDQKRARGWFYQKGTRGKWLRPVAIPWQWTG